jgi:hypothetical protein
MTGQYGVYGGPADIQPMQTSYASSPRVDLAAVAARAVAGRDALLGIQQQLFAQAWSEGAASYRAGVKLRANPYGQEAGATATSTMRDGWKGGWQEAQRIGPASVAAPQAAPQAQAQWRPQPQLFTQAQTQAATPVTEPSSLMSIAVVVGGVALLVGGAIALFGGRR